MDDIFLIDREFYYHNITYNTFTTKFKVTKITVRIEITTLNTSYIIHNTTRLAPRIRRLHYNHLQ